MRLFHIFHKVKNEVFSEIKIRVRGFSLAFWFQHHLLQSQLGGRAKKESQESQGENRKDRIWK